MVKKLYKYYQTNKIFEEAYQSLRMAWVFATGMLEQTISG